MLVTMLTAMYMMVQVVEQVRNHLSQTEPRHLDT